MYDFKHMKQDGTECGLLRNVNPDMADACEKYFTSVAQQRRQHRKEHAVKYEPYKTRTGSKPHHRHTPPSARPESELPIPLARPASAPHTYTNSMYDFSQMKDGTECGLLRNVNPDMADACEKYFTSVAQQRTSTVGRQHRKEHAVKYEPYKTRTGSKPHHRHTPPSARPESELPVVARPTSATGARVSLPTAQHLEMMTGINGWVPGCLPDANPNACLNCPNDEIRRECARINANMANNKPLNAQLPTTATHHRRLGLNQNSLLCRAPRMPTTTPSP